MWRDAEHHDPAVRYGWPAARFHDPMPLTRSTRMRVT
jgi:hypothetical protein